MKFIILESCWEHPASLSNPSLGSQNQQGIRSGAAKLAFFALNTSLQEMKYKESNYSYLSFQERLLLEP